MVDVAGGRPNDDDDDIKSKQHYNRPNETVALHILSLFKEKEIAKIMLTNVMIARFGKRIEKGTKVNEAI